MNTRRPPCRGRFIIIVVAALLTGSAVPCVGQRADRLRVHAKRF